MTDHIRFMRRALELAHNQAGRTGKNPNVGCVIVNPQGHIISEAATGDGGRPHAEQIALSALTAEQTHGAIAYVTLEPCRERSTGEASCSTTLIEAGITKVYIATRDPHPQGAGGLDRLIAAGIEVTSGLLQTEADALYYGFFKSVST